LTPVLPAVPLMSADISELTYWWLLKFGNWKISEEIKVTMVLCLFWHMGHEQRPTAGLTDVSRLQANWGEDAMECWEVNKKGKIWNQDIRQDLKGMNKVKKVMVKLTMHLIFNHRTMKMHGGVEDKLQLSWPQHKMEVSGQLHALAALSPGKDLQAPTG
jgi:hypothetical protein